MTKPLMIHGMTYLTKELLNHMKVSHIYTIDYVNRKCDDILVTVRSRILGINNL